jgi:hypothetical protein
VSNIDFLLVGPMRCGERLGIRCARVDSNVSQRFGPINGADVL